jgi:hypothetical protein
VLLKARNRGEMQFRLSDAKLTKESFREQAGFPHRRTFNSAMDLLLDMKLVKITDEKRTGRNGSTDLTIELLQPPGRCCVPGNGKSFVSQEKDETFVSMRDPHFRMLDLIDVGITE